MERNSAEHRGRTILMKIIDKYLVKQFLQTIFFGIIAFTVIFVVIDMMENLDDFIDQSVPTKIIFNYYLVFAPEIIRLITPVSVLFAALFVAGKSSSLSELTAIKASGVSMFRFMVPFLVTSFIISMLSIYFAGYVVPMANKIKVNIEMTYLKRGVNYAGANLFFQDTKSRIVNIAFFDNASDQAIRVSLQEFQPNDPTKMVSRIDAARMTYDTLRRVWKASNGVKRIFVDNGENTKYFDTLTLNYLQFTPKELDTKQRKIEEMNFAELRKFIKTQEQAGNDPTDTLIEYYSRYSFSMASFIIVFFGLPISANKRRGGIAVHVGINILVTFIYLVFMKISEAFGKNDAMNPILTAWLANLIFLAAAIYNLPKMRQ
jgi:lipopolysaccharide export system permease protein